jgi:hypothetical protein
MCFYYCFKKIKVINTCTFHNVPTRNDSIFFDFDLHLMIGLARPLWMIRSQSINPSRRKFFFGVASLGLAGSAASILSKVDTPPPEMSYDVHWPKLWMSSPSLSNAVPLRSLFTPTPLDGQAISVDLPKPADLYTSVVYPKVVFQKTLDDFNIPMSVHLPKLKIRHFLNTVHTEAAAIPSDVKQAIQVAANKTGLSTGLIATVAWFESRFQAGIVRSGNNASGLYQFLGATWLYTMFSGAADLPAPYRDQASQLTYRSGKINGPSALLKTILSWRTDPKIASLGVGVEMASNKAAITRTFGRPASHTDVYLSHALGLGGAYKFLRAVSNNEEIPQSAIGGNGRLINGPTAKDAYHKLSLLVDSKVYEYQDL